MVQEVRRSLGPNLRFVFRHFPLTQIHPHAKRAAEAAEAAGAQGKFWGMHDLLFENQDALEDADLLRYAAALSLDAERFATELSTGVYTSRVHDDIPVRRPERRQWDARVFINGARHEASWDLPTLLAAVEAAAAAVVGGHQGRR